jgi:hypothetical protein
MTGQRRFVAVSLLSSLILMLLVIILFCVHFYQASWHIIIQPIFQKASLPLL